MIKFETFPFDVYQHAQDAVSGDPHRDFFWQIKGLGGEHDVGVVITRHWCILSESPQWKAKDDDVAYLNVTSWSHWKLTNECEFSGYSIYRFCVNMNPAALCFAVAGSCTWKEPLAPSPCSRKHGSSGENVMVTRSQVLSRSPSASFNHEDFMIARSISVGPSLMLSSMLSGSGSSVTSRHCVETFISLSSRLQNYCWEMIKWMILCSVCIIH